MPVRQTPASSHESLSLSMTSQILYQSISQLVGESSHHVPIEYVAYPQIYYQRSTSCPLLLGDGSKLSVQIPYVIVRGHPNGTNPRITDAHYLSMITL